MRFFTGWSRNRKLTYSWCLLAFMFFASAVVLIVVSMVFRMQGGTKLGVHTLRTLTIGEMNLTTAVVLGGFILFCLGIGVFGFCQGLGKGNGKKDVGLIVFNWCLIATTIVTIVVGCIIWFFTLTERDDYMSVWLEQDGATQAFLQDSLSCCGYWNATLSGLFTQATGFCSGITNVTAITPCVTPITNFADYFLNNVFTTIYGFTAIEVSLFLVSVCLIISRREEERFRRLDEKHGLKGGFV